MSREAAARARRERRIVGENCAAADEDCIDPGALFVAAIAREFSGDPLRIA